MKKRNATNVVLLIGAMLLSVGLLAGLSALELETPNPKPKPTDVALFVDNIQMQDDEKVYFPGLGDSKIIELRYILTNKLYDEPLEIDFSGIEYLTLQTLNNDLNRVKLTKMDSSLEEFYISFINPAKNINKRLTIVTVVTLAESLDMPGISLWE